jgi:hypothetical protein
MSKARVEGWCCCVVGIKLNPNPRVGRVLNLGEDPPESSGFETLVQDLVPVPQLPGLFQGCSRVCSLVHFIHHQQRGHNGNNTSKKKKQTILKGCLGCRMHDHAGLYICCRTPEIARPGAVPSPRWLRCRVRSLGLAHHWQWMDGWMTPQMPPDALGLAWSYFRPLHRVLSSHRSDRQSFMISTGPGLGIYGVQSVSQSVSQSVVWSLIRCGHGEKMESQQVYTKAARIAIVLRPHTIADLQIHPVEKPPLCLSEHPQPAPCGWPYCR